MPRLRSALVVTLLAATALAGCKPSSPPGPTCTATSSRALPDRAYRTVPGVDPNLLSLDLYLPRLDARCAPTALVVYVHGGGFQTGDKANKIDDKVELFTGRGWAFASVDYRLSTPPAAGQDPIRYPTHEQDVATAIAWLRAHAEPYHLDPDRLLLVGHSSGAFLVSLLGTDTALLTAAGVPPASIRGVVSLDTEYDIAAQVAEGGSQEALYRNAFGDDPEVWAAGSPIEHTAKGTKRPAFLVVTRGAARRRTASGEFAAALRAGGTGATLLDASPLDHEGVNAAVGQVGERVVTPAVVAHATVCLAP